MSNTIPQVPRELLQPMRFQGEVIPLRPTPAFSSWLNTIQNASAVAGSGTVTSVATGTGLTGGPITTSGTVALANTAVTPGTYGDVSHVAQFTVDAQGRLTSAVNIAITSGGVTSVGLALPAEFTVSGSPVTTGGTLTAVWASELQNKVFASPNGSSGTPTFRALVTADLPAGVGYTVARHAGSATPTLASFSQNFLDGNTIAATTNASPADGDRILIYANTARTGCTVGGTSGKTVNGSASAQAIPAAKLAMCLVYDATAADWFTEFIMERT